MKDKIPINNIYYMLCYAWDYLEQGKLKEFHGDPNTSLVDLFAEVLFKNIRELNRRSPIREYKTERHEGRDLCGKINLSATIKRNLLWNGKAAFETTNLSLDSSVNQIIKATAQMLIGTDLISDTNVLRLKRLITEFAEVESIPLSNRLIHTVKMKPANRKFRPIILMCELIYDQMIPKDSLGNYYFHEFTRDPDLMKWVYEEFIRKFFQIHFDQYEVGRKNIEWHSSEGDLNYLPIMQTDISITTPNEHVILDAKYYQSTLTENKKIDSGNLYQMASYLKNRQMENPSLPVRGVLIYPTVGEDLPLLNYRIWGLCLSVRTLNLAKDWQQIHNDLILIANVS